MITFKLKDGAWQTEADLIGLSQLQMVDLKIKLVDLVHEVAGMIDANSAEDAISREIARRMNHLASKAQAAGKLSAMWTDQNSRFYKRRLAIQQGYE